MYVFSQFVFMVAFGAACSLLARGRGRSPVAWLLIGMVLNAVGIILLFVLPDLGVEEERKSRTETDLRRLRERHAKDRQVADRRHEETLRRIAVHDRALGLDTAGESALGSGEAKSPPLPPASEARAIALERLDWFYARDGAPVGPLAFDELQRLVREGWVAGSTYVWSEAFVEWRPVRAVPELAGLQNA